MDLSSSLVEVIGFPITIGVGVLVLLAVIVTYFITNKRGRGPGPKDSSDGDSEAGSRATRVSVTRDAADVGPGPSDPHFLIVDYHDRDERRTPQPGSAVDVGPVATFDAGASAGSPVASVPRPGNQGSNSNLSYEDVHPRDVSFAAYQAYHPSSPTAASPVNPMSPLSTSPQPQPATMATNHHIHSWGPASTAQYDSGLASSFFGAPAPHSPPQGSRVAGAVRSQQHHRYSDTPALFHDHVAISFPPCSQYISQQQQYLQQQAPTAAVSSASSGSPIPPVAPNPYAYAYPYDPYGVQQQPHLQHMMAPAIFENAASSPTEVSLPHPTPGDDKFPPDIKVYPLQTPQVEPLAPGGPREEPSKSAPPRRSSLAPAAEPTPASDLNHSPGLTLDDATHSTSFTSSFWDGVAVISGGAGADKSGSVDAEGSSTSRSGASSSRGWDPRAWTVMDCVGWIGETEFGRRWIKSFIENQVDGPALLALTHDAMRDRLGIESPSGRDLLASMIKHLKAERLPNIAANAPPLSSSTRQAGSAGALRLPVGSEVPPPYRMRPREE
ncbi:hypothetical protein HK101_010739 [Irineochytrium annulatum]|nr:hypothetical protein HK101_010739 [Irineochytrium annulatum]